MKSQFIKKPVVRYLGISVLFAGTLGIALAMREHPNQPPKPVIPAVVANPDASDTPKIQMAILLDTSGSMDGLIDQARSQLWQAVNEFSKAKRNGVTPILEVAVYEYGNDGLSAQRGYTRQVVGLTRDLEKVSEALFSLTTNGGQEYCGYAIQASVNELTWSRRDQDVKTIFIAGNEPFTQGSVSYMRAIAGAKAAGITVNTIHAGSYEEGVSSGWQAGAQLAGGNFMSIDHNQQIAHVVAPQDQELARLNKQLNETYVPYGEKGETSIERQQKQDANSEDKSLGMLAERVKSKVSSLYDSSEWDMVDALAKNKMEIESVPAVALPAEMQTMNIDAKKAYVKEKAESRRQIKQEIAELTKAREEYIAETKDANAPAPATLDSAVIGSVKAQAAAKQYQFEK